MTSSFRYADQVSIGDEVLVETIGQLIPTKVIDVSDFIMKGKHQFLIFSQVLHLPHQISLNNTISSHDILFLHCILAFM